MGSQNVVLYFLQSNPVSLWLIVNASIMEGTYRKNIQPGLLVRIVQKQDQRSGQLTEGIVQRILTNSPQHPHGIKVRLEDGIVGRVKEIVEEE